MEPGVARSTKTRSRNVRWESRHFGGELVRSVLHPIADMALHRNNLH